MNESLKIKEGSPSLFRYTFTVFTPTYNRAYTLNRVYRSLQEQTFKDFEWLIVDDGSTDNTPDLIKIWQKEAAFSIRYFYQTNQGKPAAFNQGVQKAQGKHFLLIDSDDAFVPVTLEKFLSYWEDIPKSLQEKFVGVSALCMDQEGRVIGDKFPADVFDSDSLEIRHKYKIKGEKWGFLKTDVLKQFAFPVLEGSKFIPEGVLWSRIAQKYKTRFINIPLRIYWNEVNKRSDQLSKISSPAVYAKGHAFWHRVKLNNEMNWFFKNPGEFFRSAVHYSRFSFHTGVGIKRQFSLLENKRAQGLWLSMLPVAFLIYWKDPK